MKHHYLLLILSALLFSGCFGTNNTSAGNKTQTTNQETVLENETDTVAQTTQTDVKSAPIRMIPNRRVFYPVFETKDSSYYVSKRAFFMIHEDHILFDELDMTHCTFRLSEIEYQGKLNINLRLSAETGTYYHHYKWIRPHGEPLEWREINIPWYGDRIRLEKDPNTLIWTIYLNNGTHQHKWRVIESYDILASGYKYENQAMCRHNPEQEKFDRPPDPSPESVMTSGMAYTEKSVNDEDYLSDPDTYRPFDGRWLELGEADTCFAVYKYWDESGQDRKYLPTTIEVRDTVLYYSSYWEDFDTAFDSVRYYDDGTVWLNNCFAIRWEDKEKGLARWTLYYSDGRVMNDYLYIREDLNKYPVVDYDCGELDMR